MAERVPETHTDLLEESVFVSLSTLMPDGQPQATVVWCDYDGTYALVNTARDRQKEKNMRQRPMATILAIDPDDPYRYLELRGTVEEITEEDAREHIDKLAQMYANQPNYYGGVAPAEMEGQETRVLCKIKPTRVRAVG